jgi:omega-6 fatty acid desaturase (delta-12 desaturase)
LLVGRASCFDIRGRHSNCKMEAVPKEAPFTLKQIRDAVPAHCFERSTFWSSFYLARDVAMALVMLLVVAPWIDTVSSVALRVVLWTAFAVLQGVILTGVWVCAHECGHSAFSSSDNINNVVGLVAHSALLVPFFSWKFTHAAHHGATNHITKDQVFVPFVEKEAPPMEKIWEVLEDAPLLNLVYAVRMFLIGWPAYLIANVSAAPPAKSDEFASHFLPNSSIFSKEQRFYVTVSNYGLVVVLGLLSIWINRYGFAHFATRYLFPYLNVNFWLIFYTYMQHTSKDVPHYDDNEWTFIRGALATIDRPYHFLDFFHHHIGTSHVAHHFFSRIPHYHAAEATVHIKKVVGKYYVYDPENVFVAFWREFCACKFVAGKDGVLWFHSSLRSMLKKK